MTPIDKDDLFKHISDYFHSKGVELKDGPYKQGIEKGCSVMAEVANSSREALEQAKVQLDKTLDHMRQSIHEKTAPKRPPAASSPPSSTTTKSTVTEVKVSPPKRPAPPKAKKAAPKPAKPAAKKKG